MFQITIGVDIAKKKFDVASLINGKYKHKVFDNLDSSHKCNSRVHAALRSSCSKNTA